MKGGVWRWGTHGFGRKVINDMSGVLKSLKPKNEAVN
jgi:hypothetical protein